MKNIKVLFIVFVLLLLGYFLRENILFMVNKQKVEEITKYLMANEIESLVVANTKGDGSETLISGLPKELRSNYKSILEVTHLFSGLKSRVYCSFYYRDGKYPVFEVTTLRTWHGSTLYFGDIKYDYVLTDVKISNKNK